MEAAVAAAAAGLADSLLSTSAAVTGATQQAMNSKRKGKTFSEDLIIIAPLLSCRLFVWFDSDEQVAFAISKDVSRLRGSKLTEVSRQGLWIVVDLVARLVGISVNVGKVTISENAFSMTD
jgi:hypothetical protein